MKKLLYLVLILIIFGLSYLKYRGGSEVVAPGVSPSPNLSSSPLPSPAWLTLTTELFTLQYPPVATASEKASSPDSRNWAVTYVGETQKASGRTQTELFDGYSVSVTAFEVVGTEPARTQAEADRQGTVECSSEDATSPIITTTIAGLSTLSFTGGCLGTATNYYFMSQSQLFRLSFMIAGDQSVLSEYQSTVSQILASFRLL